MAYVLMHGTCYGCKQLFSFHPNLVPSLTIGGTREPFCRSCIERANPTRVANGLAPIVPLPGAYEPCDESEIVY
jgi:hypothetical protein